MCFRVRKSVSICPNICQSVYNKLRGIKALPTCLSARSMSIPWFQGAAGLARQSPALPRRLMSIFWRRRVRKASAITRTPSYVSEEVYWRGQTRRNSRWVCWQLGETFFVTGSPALYTKDLIKIFETNIRSHDVVPGLTASVRVPLAAVCREDKVTIFQIFKVGHFNFTATLWAASQHLRKSCLLKSIKGCSSATSNHSAPLDPRFDTISDAGISTAWVQNAANLLSMTFRELFSECRFFGRHQTISNCMNEAFLASVLLHPACWLTSKFTKFGPCSFFFFKFTYWNLQIAQHFLRSW